MPHLVAGIQLSIGVGPSVGISSDQQPGLE
jgi:hypothetical protein